MEVREYVDEQGRSPFGRWFDGLNAIAAAKVRTALARMESGNLSNAKSVGSGVLEYRIWTGPGFRIYFGREGDRMIILLVGGTKRRQRQDIRRAQDLWQEYKDRKRRED
ncbi:MAG: type II toxin-antitoxin system RelE/ParE family toxin [Chloroflexota bacterium]|nr:type II toxin-antitoxin system RelE/ParE family toxin [Chloroflexota bacterium]MDE2896547.1 type II toxin-antitoxin system RelE/ParE family toxin [Chloroflexota bacterium]